MMVVAPSKKAAMVAAEETGSEDATTAHGLAHQHGFRWDTDGVWTRLRPGDTDPVTGHVYTGPHSTALITAGDVLVVDEAGMLDQETARALLHVADRADARVVFVGDRRQLPAVGRGGVLDMVAGWAPTQVELGAVHRFRTPNNQVDTEYADLTLRIRAGIDPEKVFDDLHQSGHVQVWDTAADALGHLAWETARRHLDGVSQAVSVATNDDAAAVNEVVREQLVTAGAVDDTHVTHGPDGLRIGVGDQVMTRQNQPDLGVANRMTWTVTGITDHSEVQLYNEARRQRTTVDPDYVRHHLHLAYAATVHGVQGDTADHGDLVLTDATDAAAVYVGLTRGRHTNTVHIIAGTLDEAREQWVAAAGGTAPTSASTRPAQPPPRRPATTRPPWSGIRSPSARPQVATGGSTSPNAWNGSTRNSQRPPRLQRPLKTPWRPRTNTWRSTRPGTSTGRAGPGCSGISLRLLVISQAPSAIQ
jgi:ATP-dependent exoDNAse (exonuclease V) alpha subunit